MSTKEVLRNLSLFNNHLAGRKMSSLQSMTAFTQKKDKKDEIRRFFLVMDFLVHC
jgi:hypothetical protein